MIEKYALWQTKRWLPLLGLIAIAFAGFFLFPAALSNVDFSHSDYYNAFSFTPIIQVAIIATLFVPFFVFSYRFSRKSADAFMQFAVPDRKIKNTRILLGLLTIMVPFVIVFWLGTMIVAIRQAISPADYWFNYGWVALGFLYLLVGIAAAYFINCAILAVANNPVDGVLAIAIIQVLLLLTLEPFNEYIRVFLPNYPVSSFNFFDFNLTLWSVSSSFDFLFSNLIKGWGFSDISGWQTEYTFECIYIPLFLIIGSLSMVFAFKKSDPSGEFFGEKGYDIAWPKYSVYVLMGFFAFLIATIAPAWSDWDYANTNNLLTFIISTIGWSLGYYAILAIQERSFKIPKKELLIGLGELALIFILAIPVSAYEAVSNVQ